MRTLSLDELAARARQHNPTPTERRQQRVSLIHGVLAHNTTLTRDRVRTLLNEIEGCDPASEPPQKQE